MEGTTSMAIFVCMYKLSERAEQTFSLFMVDKGVPKGQMAIWATIMRSLSMAGSGYGGWMLSKENANPKSLLAKYLTLRTLPVVAQLTIVMLWGTEKVQDPETQFTTMGSQ